MEQANLSQLLFKPTLNHSETSTLIQRGHNNKSAYLRQLRESNKDSNWYRLLHPLLWIWRGVNPQESIEVLARIAVSDAVRSNENLLDTVVGYRSGNWIYEWVQQGMHWQKLAKQQDDPLLKGQSWLTAANIYGLAGYPYLKGDMLAEQAAILATRAYEEASLVLPYQLKPLKFDVDGGSLSGFLHMPQGDNAPYPVVIVCGSLDTLQIGYHYLFRRYLAPAGIAMLTLDMPSLGAASKWRLTPNSSSLYLQVLEKLEGVPWIDHTRISVFGLRFGANIAVRLAYLAPNRLRGVACLGGIVHNLLCNAQSFQQLPDMYIDILASCMGMANISDDILRLELSHYSLKIQGLLGRRCSTPMLASYWETDLFSPKEEAQLIANSSLHGQLLAIPKAPVYAGFHDALQQITDWLKDRMS